MKSDGNRSPISFEVIAPPQTWETASAKQWATKTATILQKHKVSHLNLPEVVDEARLGNRPIPYLPKMDHVRFGELIREKRPEVILIPHKRCAQTSKEAFASWVQKVDDKGIQHIVVVGGASRKITYPGWSVLEAAAYIKENAPKMKIGGITIFSRAQEPKRIVAKMKSGITFFLSQIIFATDAMKHVLTDLGKQCRDEGVDLPEVYISLAPLATSRDIEFMRWLGIEFPSAVFSHLLGRDEQGLEARIFDVLERVVDEVCSFAQEEKLSLGFNIGHVMYDNLDLAERLLELVASRIAA